MKIRLTHVWGLIAFILLHIQANAQEQPDGLVIPPFEPVAERTPAFPLKTSRSLFSDEEIEIALRNIKNYSSANLIHKEILELAEYWISLTDEEVLNLMPDARVPRGFDLCAKGCPVHGDSVFKVAGTYPWILDPKTPFQVKCPIGGEVYPSNDFSAYYHDGLKQKPSGRYADDGWGWVSPEGDRYWFVAYANQWMWYRHTIPGLLALSRAYLLTKDSRFAERAAFMLYRLAEIYPSMDHENQSRYGLMEKMKGNRYSGKILNRIWETQLIKDVAEAYDHIWEYIDQCAALQRFTGKSGIQIRSFIEANVLEDGLDAIEQGKIAGNFGMHQNSLLYLHLVRQHAGKAEAIEKMTEAPARNMAQNGLMYALYNQVFRDGMALESPGYNAHWLKDLVSIGEVLKKGGKNILANPRFKSLLDAPIDLVAIGKYTPDWGDGGSTTGGLIARLPDTYQIGYNQFKDPRYLSWIGKSGNSSFTSFNSLFREVLPDPPTLQENRATPPATSRLFAGYGLGILNNPSDKTAIAFTYGMHYAHYHWDFLNIELFANGQKMMPDLGYPDAMNTYVAPVYTWSMNTISHNTVVVDAQKQPDNLPGILHDFYDGSFARVADFSSPAYPQTSHYRRKLFMVDCEDDQSYVVDFFHVKGGRQHDYSLHGPPGQVILTPQEWSTPRKGTLAGETVRLEELYDDPDLQKNGAQKGYRSYRGSGFQHLFNVQKKLNGNGMVEYHHQNDPSARLRLHTLTDEIDELFIADAYDLPRAKKHQLKYLIARRKAPSNDPLESTFVSIFEPYQGSKPTLRHARKLKLDAGNGIGVWVERNSVNELILQDTTGSIKKINALNLETDAASVVITWDTVNRPLRVFFSDGSYVKIGNQKFEAKPIIGVVEAIDVKKKEVTVQLSTPASLNKFASNTLIAHFGNRHRKTVHPIQNLKFNRSKLTFNVKDDLIVGKLQISANQGRVLHTNTSLTFQKQYNGVTLLNSEFIPISTVSKVNGIQVHLDAPVPDKINVGDVFWLSNLGLGDEFHIKSGFSQILH